MDQQNQIDSPVVQIAVDQINKEQYIPSSVERKKALMMYFLFGIIIVISNKNVNDFEFFHVKQAMGWWMVFIFSILISVVILFIPIVKIFAILRLLFLMGVFIVFAKQSWDGKAYSSDLKYPLAIFPSLGTWLFGLFGIDFNKKEVI